MTKEERKIRLQKAMEMRLAGCSYQEIADSGLYRTQKAAWKSIDRFMEKTVEEPSKKVIDLEIKRLDRMLLTLTSKVKGGDLGAIDRAIKIMERRAKYKGLDAAGTYEVPNMRIEVVMVDAKSKKEESKE